MTPEQSSISIGSGFQGAGQTVDGPFAISAASSLQEKRPRTLKHGDTFAVFDRNGDALSGEGSAEGLFYRDTRHLSHLYLTIDGLRPLLLSSTVRDDNVVLTCDLTNPDLFSGGKRVLDHDLIHVRRSRFLWNSACLERLSLRNFDEQPRRISIALSFDADFADLFEVRGTTRKRRGETAPPIVSSDRVVISYTGLDKKRRTTTLSFEPTPAGIGANYAVFVFDLAPRESQSFFFEISCDEQGVSGSPRRAFFSGVRGARRVMRKAQSRGPFIGTSNDIFNDTVRRSIADLYTLITDKPEGPYPYAGIPWFSTVFGRDALITALETMWFDPAIARGVLGHLAANQANHLDPVADAEPGKILHEVREGEMAELGEVPFRRYYGSIDSTPLFVLLAGAYLRRTGDLATIGHLWPKIEAALSWIDEYGDRDDDGFVEYGRRAADGLINQGWKDSHDSIFHEDGTIARGPIALVEVQAYVYGAWQSAAEMARRLGHSVQAEKFTLRAAALRRDFDVRFFDEALGTYVLALDGDKRPCRVRSSNAGHALFTGIAYPERAESVVRALMGPTSFCGWGIRTLASREARYNPMSYHNGSVWPHDNALIAAGFARYGYRRAAARVFEGLFAASTYIDLRRLPELFCGFPRQRTQGPTFYPVACTPQAWAAVAPLSMIQSCLGIGFDLDQAQIAFEDPVLPDFLNEVTFRNLSIAKGAADITVRRSGPSVVVDVLERKGQVRILSVN